MTTQPSDLQALADHLDQLAEDARQKAAAEQSGDPTGYPPGYWYGVAFGLETAAGEVREVVAAASGNRHSKGGDNASRSSNMAE